MLPRGRLGLAACKSPKDVAQNLAKDVATRHLWSARPRWYRTGLSARYGYLHRPDNHRFDATLADPFLHLAQDITEQIAAGHRLLAGVCRSRG